eukprot:GHVR01071270.1.p1 GENE.GHVR01071270.1~~GHVR01071270.1.p1  ORF type:complete len:209 (+),score=12.81 GHVR01071270.1:345-971(+)
MNYWHVPSLKQIFHLKEENNTILTMDFTKNGAYFATGGSDCNIRIYDECILYFKKETKTVNQILKKADWSNVGHDNRVFAVKFIDDNTLISGGWDAVIHVWDIRESKSIRHFYGSHISGESLDYMDGRILAGCYSAKKQIQIWKFNTGTKVEEIDWTSGNVDDAEYIYTAVYDRKNPGIFGVGSMGNNSEVRIYKETNEDKHKVINSI